MFVPCEQDQKIIKCAHRLLTTASARVRCCWWFGAATATTNDDDDYCDNDENKKDACDHRPQSRQFDHAITATNIHINNNLFHNQQKSQPYRGTVPYICTDIKRGGLLSTSNRSIRVFTNTDSKYVASNAKFSISTIQINQVFYF